MAANSTGDDVRWRLFFREKGEVDTNDVSRSAAMAQHRHIDFMRKVQIGESSRARAANARAARERARAQRQKNLAAKGGSGSFHQYAAAGG